MPELKNIPKKVLDIAKENGVVIGDVASVGFVDRSVENVPCDTYIFFDNKMLLFVSGINILKKKEKKKVFDAPIERDYKALSVSKRSCEGLSDFKIEKQIADSILTCKNEFGRIALIRMSNKAAGECNEFIYEINKVLGCEGEARPPRKEEIHRCPKCGEAYPDQMRRVCPKCIDRAGVLKRIWFFAKKYKASVFAIFGAMVMSSLLSVIAPYISSGFYYDNVLDKAGKLYGQIALVMGILISTRVLSLLINMVNEVICARVVPKIIYDLKKTIFHSIERLSMSFFSNRQTGALMNQVNGDSNTIYWIFVEGIPYMIVNLIQSFAALGIMVFISWKMTVIAVFMAPAVFVLTKLLMGKMNKLHAKNYSNQRSLSGTLTDALNGVRVVKAFAREAEEKKRFSRRNNAQAASTREVGIYNTTLFRFVAFFFTIASTMILGFGGWMVIKGEISYGTLITFTAYATMLYSPLTFFVNITSWIADATNAMQRLMEVMDAEPEVMESENAIKCERLRGDIEFKNVHFGYDKKRKIIDNVSLSVKAGETLGIVGHTGAGKSTLANLLIRLYDADEGEITIDGNNVRDLSFETLRQNIAIVSQETYLFAGTIYDNIAYARPDATREEIVLAARASGAHDFISKLPDGYSTKIGFGNADLSGGEKQRVSIARALLRDPSILILDEATSAMDTKTERGIQAALEKLSEGRTTIMIAHRLSTLRYADKLTVIDNGKVKEEGTHLSLIREKGLYYKLYMLQYEALKNAGVEE